MAIQGSKREILVYTKGTQDTCDLGRASLVVLIFAGRAACTDPESFEALMKTFLLLTLAVVCCTSLWAQTGATATVIGTVTDPTGAVVTGATITATNVETRLTRAAVTDNEGNYTIFSLPVGTYDVRAQSRGFRVSDVKDVVLTIDQKARLDFRMTVGETSETVTITGESPIVKTDDSSTSQVIVQKAIVDLPINGRDFMALSRLTANVNTGDGYNITSGSVGTVIKDQAPGSVYGQRNSNNVFRLDGIQVGELTGNRSRLEPNLDAVEEFTLIKGIYPAEFGSVSGSTVNVASKSGTNELHGTLFEFLRNNDLDTRNFFDTTGHAPDLKRNQFGATIGGHIKKDKTFYFLSYDALRLRDATVATSKIPSLAQLAGNFAGETIVDPLANRTPFPNSQIPASRFDPLAKSLAAFYPAPNNSDPNRNYISAFSESVDENQGLGRIDHRLTSKDQFFGRFAYAKIQDARAPVIQPFATYTEDTSQSSVVALTHTFSPTTLDEARFGYTRIKFFDSPLQTFPNFPSQFNIPDVTRDPRFADVPIFSISGYSALGASASTPDVSTQNNFEFVDNLLLHRGAHSFKIGFDLIHRQIQQFVPQTKKGSLTFANNFTGDNVADFLLGLPSQTQVGASQYISNGNMKMTDYGAYIQDDWQVSPFLTLNLGLRYDVHGAPIDLNGTTPNFNPAKGDFQVTPFTGNTPIYSTDRLDFAPRFGFALRPFKDNKTVVRGGYGIYINSNNYDEFLFLPYNPPFGNVLTFQSLTTTPTLSLSNPFPSSGASAGAPTAYGIAQNLQMGRVQFYTVGIEREIAKNTVVEISFVGNKSTHLAKAVNFNYAPPGPGALQTRRVLRQDLGSIVIVEPWSDATYNSLQAQVERRLSGGLLLLSSYAWGKALTDVPTSTGDKGSATYQNPFCTISCEKGDPTFDLHHRFTTNVIYELPFGRGRHYLSNGRLVDAVLGGWDVASIITVQSGRPMTVIQASDPLNTGLGNARANYVGGSETLSSRTINQWVNTAAFGVPPPYTPGNLGYGTFDGPGLFSMDLSIYKTFSITERKRLQFRTEFFNIPNHVNFNNPGLTLGTSTFGVITSAGDPRVLQFGLKFLF